jgi:hypothetical protein
MSPKQLYCKQLFSGGNHVSRPNGLYVVCGVDLFRGGSPRRRAFRHRQDGQGGAQTIIMQINIHQLCFFWVNGNDSVL